MNPQGRLRYYAHLGRDDLANPDWIVFRQEIRTHIGKHLHRAGRAGRPLCSSKGGP